MNTVFFRQNVHLISKSDGPLYDQPADRKEKQQFLDETAGFPARHIIS